VTISARYTTRWDSIPFFVNKTDDLMLSDMRLNWTPSLPTPLKRFVSFIKSEFVRAPVPQGISARYDQKFRRPINLMHEQPYRKLRSALEEKLSADECGYLFLAFGFSIDDALDAGRIAQGCSNSAFYVATVLRGAECLLENNKTIRPLLQDILDLRFEDTLDLAETYIDLRRRGEAKNKRVTLINSYLASLSEFERVCLRICYGSACEACIDVTQRHYGLKQKTGNVLGNDAEPWRSTVSSLRDSPMQAP
jgi:hypothetical protein